MYFGRYAAALIARGMDSIATALGPRGAVVIEFLASVMQSKRSTNRANRPRGGGSSRHGVCVCVCVWWWFVTPRTLGGGGVPSWILFARLDSLLDRDSS